MHEVYRSAPHRRRLFSAELFAHAMLPPCSYHDQACLRSLGSQPWHKQRALEAELLLYVNLEGDHPFGPLFPLSNRLPVVLDTRSAPISRGAIGRSISRSIKPRKTPAAFNTSRLPRLASSTGGTAGQKRRTRGGGGTSPTRPTAAASAPRPTHRRPRRRRPRRGRSSPERFSDGVGTAASGETPPSGASSADPGWCTPFTPRGTSGSPARSAHSAGPLRRRASGRKGSSSRITRKKSSLSCRWGPGGRTPVRVRV